MTILPDYSYIVNYYLKPNLNTLFFNHLTKSPDKSRFLESSTCIFPGSHKFLKSCAIEYLCYFTQYVDMLELIKLVKKYQENTSSELSYG